MDDTLLLVTAAVLLIASIIALKLFAGSKSGKTEDEAQPAVQEARPRPQQRALAERGNRVRMRMNAGRRQQADAQGSEEELSGSDVDAGPRVEIPEGMKVGKKKMAKLEAKAEKKSMREAEEREREERKEREAKEEETRRKQEEMEKKLEEEKEEAERKEREEREKREHEEYLKMKAAFSVEEEGCEGTEEADERNLLQDFISYIKNVKVVPLDDLAAHFKLKTVDAINRVEHLVSEGSITGVMDDRGKFIYIGQEELESVAKFIRQRGRVSLTELVQESNKLINLEPDITALESIAEVK